MRIALVGATGRPERHVLDLVRRRVAVVGFLVDAIARGSHVHEIAGLAR
jgi:hypothetical protein